MIDENKLFARTEESDYVEMEAVQETNTGKFLIFVSDGLFFGVDADYVAEIITHTTITTLPMVPHYVSGIINLRGQIVPIIDIRLMLGKAPGDGYCTIVLEIEGTQFGILVDSVDQMVDIPRDIIVPTPSQNAQRLVCGMCTIPGSTDTMLLLDCPLLLHD